MQVPAFDYLRPGIPRRRSLIKADRPVEQLLRGDALLQHEVVAVFLVGEIRYCSARLTGESTVNTSPSR